VRGSDSRTGELFSYVDIEALVRQNHPLRAIRGIVNGALAALADDFAALYSPIGRPSIPPEKLLRAMLAFYSIRSERLLMERLEYDLLFGWFVEIGVDDPAWDHSVFSKNRDRLLEGDIAAKFLAAVLAHPRMKRLLSSDHFSVDGTLIEAWASTKSVKPKDGADEPPVDGGGRNAEADFHGQKRSNETHASTTDPDAGLYRKGRGKEANPCFMGHDLMGNRHGLLVDACLTLADGHADQVPWPRLRRVGLHLQRRRLQSGAVAEAAGGANMTAPAGCRLIGRWRIVEADLWDRDYLDLSEPATITIGADNHGEIAFGALQAGLDLGYGPSTWAGCDEMDEVTGDGHAELLDDGSIEITFAYYNGDEAILKATRVPSSTAC
jgi:transposase